MVTRRDFLKLSGVGAVAAGTALAGLPRSHGAVRRLSNDRRVVATLCSECPARCALHVQVAGERVLDVQGNLGHPMACPEACPGVERALRRLDAPERLRGPLRRSGQRGRGFQEMSWGAAITLVSQVFTAYQPGEIAFVLGDFPDHLSDLVHRLAGALGGSTVLRFTSSSLLDARVTLQDAARMMFGLPNLPYFDLPHSDLVFSFGASGREPWLARFVEPFSRPVGQSWVHFSPIRPALTGTVDEWVPIRPGGEAVLAEGLGRLVDLLKAGADIKQTIPAEVIAASSLSAIPVDRMVQLARRFTDAPSALAFPGASCLGQAGGLAAAQAVLALNVLSGSLGRPGGMYLQPESPPFPGQKGRTATLAEVQALIQRMESGQVKALFVHDVDLVADLPSGLGAERALEKVERILLFNSFINETIPFADALLPDHLPLESWGYQRLSPAADRAIVSAIQPVIPPRYATRPTADVLLEAVHRAGGKLAAQLPFQNELEWIRQAVRRLPWGADIADPWAQWLTQGGWWRERSDLLPPVSLRPVERLFSGVQAPWALDPSGVEFNLHFAPTASGTASLTALPGELCMVGMHPAAAVRLGLRSGDVVRLSTASNEIDARVVELAELRSDTLVIPLPNGRLNSLGAFDLIGVEQNESGDLAYQSGRVSVKRLTLPTANL